MKTYHFVDTINLIKEKKYAELTSDTEILFTEINKLGDFTAYLASRHLFSNELVYWYLESDKLDKQ